MKLKCRLQQIVKSLFSLCSLILGPQPSFPSCENHEPPKTPHLLHVCGPGGAGACCPEDRGTAGSQNDLSVPLPLHCNPPGTALSPAPAVRMCVWMCVWQDASWLSGSRKAGVCEWAWVCLSLPPPPLKHTILSVTVSSWWLHLYICSPASSSAPPYEALTWLNAPSSHPDYQWALRVHSTGLECCAFFAFCLYDACCLSLRGLHEHECDWEMSFTSYSQLRS